MEKEVLKEIAAEIKSKANRVVMKTEVEAKEKTHCTSGSRPDKAAFNSTAHNMTLNTTLSTDAYEDQKRRSMQIFTFD